MKHVWTSVEPTDVRTDEDTDEDADAACPPFPAGVEVGEVGEARDHRAEPIGRVVLMGGGPEVDAATERLVSAAGGGDVLVLRASGSATSYLDYFASQVGAEPPPSRVRVLRLDEASASGHPAVRCAVDRAEAIWLAGWGGHRRDERGRHVLVGLRL